MYPAIFSTTSGVFLSFCCKGCDCIAPQVNNSKGLIWDYLNGLKGLTKKAHIKSERFWDSHTWKKIPKLPGKFLRQSRVEIQQIWVSYYYLPCRFEIETAIVVPSTLFSLRPPLFRWEALTPPPPLRRILQLISSETHGGTPALIQSQTSIAMETSCLFFFFLLLPVNSKKERKF